MAQRASGSAAASLLQVFFETGDDHLAAFLELRGCRRVGFGLDPESDEPCLTHVFDDDSERIRDGTCAFVRAEGDSISAGQFTALASHLRRLRQDEETRLSHKHLRAASNDDE